MTSEEDSGFPLLIFNPETTTKYIKSQDESVAPSTIIPMSSRSLSSSPPRRLSRNDDATKKEGKVRRPLNKSRSTVNDTILANISARLTKRKKLHKQCSLVNDIMCFIGLLGILLMIFENELTFVSLDHRETQTTWFIKLIITFSTIILIGLIISYYYLSLKLYCVNNSIQHWYVALTRTKIIQIIVEILICAIHPVLRGLSAPPDLKDVPNHLNSTVSTLNSIPISFLPIDVALGLPMFARLYLLCRVITYHSRFLRDASSQSLGYLNQVSIDFFFVIKAYLEQSPAFCLIIFCILSFGIGSWSLRACNYTATQEHLAMANSTWLFFTLFTTVGYGDLIPTTYCGRGVATTTAIVGVMTTAFLIAILSQKLLLSRWEKYVYNFVLNIELVKARKHHAACVIQYGWKVWHLTKLNQQDSFEYVNAQRKFFGSMCTVKELKRERRNLVDSIIGPAELMIAHREVSAKNTEIETKMNIMASKIDIVEETLNNINRTMRNIENRLDRLIDK